MKCNHCGSEVQQFAEGTDTPVEPVVAEMPQQQPQPQQGLAPQAPEPQAQEPEFKATDFQMPSNVQDSINQPSPMQTMQQKFAADKEANKQDMVDQNNKFADDLVNGHITPKTYQDLYAEKSTAGKIGTLFGLLVSGAGSGLSHQPNMFMQMMDKQISNDLQAQMKSKENAQNFWRINQADLANKTGSMVSVEAAKTAAIANTKAQMYQVSYHDLLQKVNAMPPAQQAKYRAALQAMSPEIMKNIANLEDVASTAMAAQGINPFNGQKSGQAPQGNAQPRGSGSAPQGKQSGKPESKDSKPDYSKDHILKPGASDSFTRAQYSPQYNSDSKEVQDQLEKASQADKAIDVLNEHFPQLVANIKNIKHPSGSHQPMGAGIPGLDTVGDKASDVSGWLHRKSENLETVPYVGKLIGGLGETLTDTQKNRDYDIHREAIATAMANVLTNSGLTPTKAQDIINKILPEIGDDTQMSRTKLKTAIEKIKTAATFNALDRHNLTRKQSK